MITNHLKSLMNALMRDTQVKKKYEPIFFFKHLSTLMLLTDKFANTKLCKNPEKPLKPLANGYSSESAQQEPSNEDQHDRVLVV